MILDRHLAKRGSLQLSIEAIVVLIIAITVLGLGLSFVKSLFGGTFEKLKGISEQLSEEDRRSLENSQFEITLLTSEITVTGKDVGLNFAIRNNRRSTVKFQLQGKEADRRAFTCFDVIADDTIRTRVRDTANPIIKFDTFPDIKVDAGKSAVIPLKISVEATAPPTIYACKLELKIIEEPAGQVVPAQIYSTKEFSIIKQ